MFERSGIMKALWAPLAIPVFSLAIASCGPEAPDGDEADPGTDVAQQIQRPLYEEITVDQLLAMMAESDPFLVNVHIPFQGDIPGTDESIRFDRIADHLDKLPPEKDANVVLYCRSGRMSREAGATLASLGYTNVSHLDGGFLAWDRAGYPIERTPDR